MSFAVFTALAPDCKLIIIGTAALVFNRPVELYCSAPISTLATSLILKKDLSSLTLRIIFSNLWSLKSSLHGYRNNLR